MHAAKGKKAHEEHDIVASELCAVAKVADEKIRKCKCLGKVGGRTSKLKPLTGRHCHVEIDKTLCEEAEIEDMECPCQGDVDADESIDHSEASERAALGVADDDTQTMHRKDIS